jgi:hypothetical protein
MVRLFAAREKEFATPQKKNARALLRGRSDIDRESAGFVRGERYGRQAIIGNKF